jgi:hypothetical protein
LKGGKEVAIQPNFIKDLKFVYEHDCCKNALSGQFLSELSKVYSMEAAEEARTDEEYSTDDLLNLGRRLEELRSSVQKKINERIEPLRENDPENPLFCNVSLYAPMDYGRLEVAHTRTLAWLLDSRIEEHEFGGSLLQALLPLFDDGTKDREFQIIDVISEQIHYDNDNEILGRTDIWIEGIWKDDNNPFLIVIEAKIDASEGNNQLDRYEDAIKRRSIKHVFRVFLTPDGDKPTKENWLPVSFSQIAGRLAVASRDLKDKQGYHFLRFYIASIIRDILGWKWKMVGEANPYLLLSYLNQMKGEI